MKLRNVLASSSATVRSGATSAAASSASSAMYCSAADAVRAAPDATHLERVHGEHVGAQLGRHRAQRARLRRQQRLQRDARHGLALLEAVLEARRHLGLHAEPHALRAGRQRRHAARNARHRRQPRVGEARVGLRLLLLLLLLLTAADAVGAGAAAPRLTMAALVSRTWLHSTSENHIERSRCASSSALRCTASSASEPATTPPLGRRGGAQHAHRVLAQRADGAHVGHELGDWREQAAARGEVHRRHGARVGRDARHALHEQLMQAQQAAQQAVAVRAAPLSFFASVMNALAIVFGIFLGGFESTILTNTSMSRSTISSCESSWPSVARCMRWSSSSTSTGRNESSTREISGCTMVRVMAASSRRAAMRLERGDERRDQVLAEHALLLVAAQRVTVAVVLHKELVDHVAHRLLGVRRARWRAAR
jgi:hypothetical protein